EATKLGQQRQGQHLAARQGGTPPPAMRLRRELLANPRIDEGVDCDDEGLKIGHREAPGDHREGKHPDDTASRDLRFISHQALKSSADKTKPLRDCIPFSPPAPLSKRERGARPQSRRDFVFHSPVTSVSGSSGKRSTESF